MLIREENSEIVIDEISLENLPLVAEAMLENAQEYTVWLFYGEMGAGKTTLIKNICQALEVEDEVSSPTFPIVQEYKTQSGEPVYHFDFYRLRSEEEASDIGVDEYFYSGNMCLVEWPDKVPSFWPEQYVSVTITVVNEKTRLIRLMRHDG